MGRMNEGLMVVQALFDRNIFSSEGKATIFVLVSGNFSSRCYFSCFSVKKKIQGLNRFSFLKNVTRATSNRGVIRCVLNKCC